MRIAVTGSTGFIGQHVVDFLVNAGYEVAALARDAAKGARMPWAGKAELIEGDICLEKDWMDILQHPDKVIHLAWSGLPDYYNWHHLTNNLPVNFKFLHSLAKGGLKDLTIAGTCLEYGFREGELTEDMQPEPANPYALAKDTLRRAAEQLSGQYDLELKWLRLFYTYGEGQKSSAIIPQLQEAINRSDKTFNMSGGEQVRDYLPVKELAANICMVALQDEVTGIINCCSGKGIKIKDLVSDYLEKNKVDMQLNLGYYPYPDYEPFEFWGDSTKLTKAVTRYRQNRY